MRDFYKPGLDNADSDSSLSAEMIAFDDNNPTDDDSEGFSIDSFVIRAHFNHIQNRNENEAEATSNDSDYVPESEDDDDNDSNNNDEESTNSNSSNNEEMAETTVAGTTDGRNNPQPGGSNSNGKENLASSDLDDNEEDDTVRAIIAAIKKSRAHPPDIKLDNSITDISFHPEKDIIAIGTMTGDVILYEYGNDENKLLKSIEVHTKACRDIEFTEDGKTLLTVSKDKSIMLTDIETEKLKMFYENAHSSPIYRAYILDEHLFSTGDDSGTVKLWDSRINDPIFSLKEVEDYISAMLTNEDKKLLLFTSGDGYLTTINIGSRKLYVQSEPYDEELTCMGLYRNDSKVIIGTSKGRLYSFKWGEFGYHSDMFPGMKTGMFNMLPLTDRIGCIGGMDGVLRAAHIAPFRNLGVVGQHSLPVESMDINSTGELIASSSFDNDVKFWNVKYFEDFTDIKYNDKHDSYKEKRHNLPSSKYSNASDFFSGLAGEDN